jgi:hypothetical protein
MEDLEIQKRKRGGQPGNQNALKHGFYTKDKIAVRREENRIIKDKWKEFQDNINLLVAAMNGNNSSNQAA